MRIRVLFFGILRDLTGQRECDVELSEGITAAGLFRLFRGAVSGARTGAEKRNRGP